MMPEHDKVVSKKNVRLIEDSYNIKICGLKRLSAGGDRNTCTYQIESETKKLYYLKVRNEKFNMLSIVIPDLLSQQISKHIIKPVNTANGQLFTTIKNHTIIIYPFISGKSGYRSHLSVNQWEEFGKLMLEIHSTKLPPTIRNIPYEKFGAEYRIILKNYLDRLNNMKIRDEYAREFIKFLLSKKNEIYKIITRTEELSVKIKKTRINYCLCHGDIHPGNIIIPDSNDFYIVDWDTLIMAPKERDLMFIGAGIGNKWNTEEEINNFYRGYGQQKKVDILLLTYYRCERIIVDLVEFFNHFFEKRTDEKDKEIIIEIVKSIFDKGNIVDMVSLNDKYDI